MPIKVTCACGQSFAAKDELAGRTVKCPKCGQPLSIPAAQPPATQAPLAATQPMPGGYPSPIAQAQAPQGAPAPSLFDEVGIKSAPMGTFPCPGCGEPMAQNTILCVKCGYNIRLGRRMETMRTGGGGGGGPVTHGEVVAGILEKAARSIEDEKLEEKKKVREGLPWWSYLIMLILVVGFMAGMMLIPQAQAIQAAGIVLMILGTIGSLYSVVRVLIIAFYDHPGHGVGCLLCWVYMLVYVIMKWDECSGFFFIWLASQVVQGAGYGILIAAALFQDDTPVGSLWLAREYLLACLPLLWHPQALVVGLSR